MSPVCAQFTFAPKEDGSFPEMVTASTVRTRVQSKTTVHGCNSCWCSLLSPKTVDVTEMVFVDNRAEDARVCPDCRRRELTLLRSRW